MSKRNFSFADNMDIATYHEKEKIVNAKESEMEPEKNGSGEEMGSDDNSQKHIDAEKEAYQAHGSETTYITKTITKNSKGMIVSVVILTLLFILSGLIALILYNERINYQQTISSLTNEKNRLNTTVSQLDKDLITAENSRDSYKKKYDDLYSTYNKNKNDNTTFNNLISAMAEVTTEDFFGSFPGKMIAVKKGETVTVEFTYNDINIVAWSDHSAMSFNWQKTYIPGAQKFTLKGLKTGVYTLRVTTNAKTSSGGITAVVWIYE